MDRTGRQYVRKLEEALARRGEGPRVFTQRDYRLATRWHEEGIPLGLILEILDRRKVAARTLAQVAARVEESWKAVCAGRLRERDEPAPPGPVPTEPDRRLESALENAAPSSGLQRLLLRILEEQRAGAPPDVLERIIDAELPGAVLPRQLQEAEEQARISLAAHRDRMPPQAFRETIRRSVLARLRRAAGIPRLH